jgi:hypothetical protein
MSEKGGSRRTRSQAPTIRLTEQYLYLFRTRSSFVEGHCGFIHCRFERYIHVSQLAVLPANHLRISIFRPCHMTVPSFSFCATIDRVQFTITKLFLCLPSFNNCAEQRFGAIFPPSQHPIVRLTIRSSDCAGGGQLVLILREKCLAGSFAGLKGPG